MAPLAGVGIYMDGQDGQDGGPWGGADLTPRPPLHHVERGWIAAFAGMTGYAKVSESGNDGGAGAIHRAPTEKPTLVRGQPPYGPPAAAGGRVSPAGGGQEAATVLLKVPRPVISTSTTSPAWRYTSCTEPTPAGVPVAMTSPGARVMNLLIHSMVSAM